MTKLTLLAKGSFRNAQLNAAQMNAIKGGQRLIVSTEKEAKIIADALISKGFSPDVHPLPDGCFCIEW